MVPLSSPVLIKAFLIEPSPVLRQHRSLHWPEKPQLSFNIDFFWILKLFLFAISKSCIAILQIPIFCSLHKKPLQLIRAGFILAYKDKNYDRVNIPKVVNSFSFFIVIQTQNSHDLPHSLLPSTFFHSPLLVGAFHF